MLLVLLALIIGTPWYLVVSVDEQTSPARAATVAITGILLFITIVSGFMIVSPNEAGVVQFFGRYVGSIRNPGYYWTVPFSTRRKLSLRVRNFETARLKVADSDGNPVEIAA